MNSYRRGFTLAELLIVVVILGILGGIALPRFYPQAEKARVAEAVAMLSAIRQGEMAYHLEKGVYMAVSSASSTGWADIGLDQPPSGNATYWTYTVTDTTNGPATALRTAKGNPSAAYSGKTVILNIDGTWGGNHPNKPS